MKIVTGKNIQSELERQANRRILFSADTEKLVARIIADIRRHGDRALRRYATKFDSLERNQPIKVEPAEMKQALDAISPKLRSALETAAANIRQFA